MHFFNRTSIPWEPYLGTTGLPSYVMGALARQDADGRSYRRTIRIACGPGLTMADGLRRMHIGNTPKLGYSTRARSSEDSVVKARIYGVLLPQQNSREIRH
jgi:hypothetical protein